MQSSIRHQFAKGRRGSSGDPDATCQACGITRRRSYKQRDCTPSDWGVRETMGLEEVLGFDHGWLYQVKVKVNATNDGVILNRTTVGRDEGKAWRTKSLGEAQAMAKLMEATFGMSSVIQYRAHKLPPRIEVPKRRLFPLFQKSRS